MDTSRADAAALSQSGTEEDAGDTAGDDATSAAERYWIACHVTEAQLQEMADEGVIPAKKDGGWRSAEGDTEPKPQPGEQVMLTSHFHRDLGFPPRFSSLVSLSTMDSSLTT